MPVDLDAVEAGWRQLKVQADLTVTGRVYEVIRAVPALVAELRAARETVEAVPGVGRLRALADWMDMDDRAHGRASDEVQQELRALADALARYDKAVGL
jgi:hypothetical protein